MFSKMLYSSRIKGLRKSLTSRKRERCVVMPSQLESCIVYRDSKNDDPKLFEKLVNSFPGVEFVSLWRVYSKESKVVNQIPLTGSDAYIHPSFLKDKGLFSEERITTLLNRDFDWLIDLSFDQSELTALVLAVSMAKCKISWRYAGDFVADITISDIKNREEYIDSLRDVFDTLNCNDEE